MKFLLDEGAEYRLAIYLRQGGHDVTTIVHDYPQSLADDAVLAIAVREGRIVLTNDRDFGDLVVRQHLPHAGIIYFRLGMAATLTEKIDWLERLLREHQDKLRQFIVVTPRGVRVRR